jgi:hypothetical protein
MGRLVILRRGSEQPQRAVFGAAQGVAVEDEAPDTTILGQYPGLRLDLLGGEDPCTGGAGDRGSANPGNA